MEVDSKSGAWFAYNDAKIGQGRENAKNYLRENPEIMEKVENKVREFYGLKTNPADEKSNERKSKRNGREGSKSGEIS